MDGVRVCFVARFLFVGVVLVDVVWVEEEELNFRLFLYANAAYFKNDDNNNKGDNDCNSYTINVSTIEQNEIDVHEQKQYEFKTNLGNV